MEETHVYTVTPWRPIRGLVKGKLITKPTNLNLTKDEVLMCMKHGPVYRKFYLDGSERVTPSNLDRLHRSEHLTEEQYKALCEKLVKEDTTEVEEEQVEEVPVIEAEVESEVPEEEVKEEEIPDEEEVEESKKEEEEQLPIEDEEIDTTNIDLLSNPVDVVPKKKSRKNKKKSSASKSNNTEIVQKDE